MAPGGQRIFSLVPTTLVASNVRDPRPMTSKAAKKAYQKANRGPKVTRAEQRRLDAEEREREKKEFEREKAANKAKAARERKAEKENAAKQERRKKGIPEPSKFVRPSQPTISRFVKTGAGKRKWLDTESVGEDSEGTVAEDEEAGRGPPPAKRLALITEDEENDDTRQCVQDWDVSGQLTSGEKAGDVKPQSGQRMHEPESEDEFGDFPAFSQAGFLEEVESPLLPPTRKPSPSAASKISRQTNLNEERDVLELPARPIIDEDYLFDDSQQMSDMANAQLISEAEAITKSDDVEPNASDSFEVVKSVVLSASLDRSQQWASTNSRVQGGKSTTVPTKPAMSHPRFEIPPLPSRSPAEPRTSPVHTFLPRANARQFVTPSSRKISNSLPTSTQAFLEDNIDEFMPTPSQEMRELFDDIDDDELPSNTQIAREISPPKPKTLPNPQLNKVEEIYDDFICTQDLILSSQDMREISPMKAKPAQEIVMKATTFTPPVKQSTNSVPKPAFRKETFDESILENFLSTQDLALTPEDLKEIGLGKPELNKTLVEKQVTSKPAARQGTTPAPQPAFRKGAFALSIFDEFPSTQELTLTPEDLKEIKTPSRGPLRTINNLKKEMSLLLGEVQKPKKGPAAKTRKSTDQSIELPQIGSKPTEKAAKKQKDPPKPRTNARDKRRFFEEKETDLVQAPVSEAQVSVQKKAPMPPPMMPERPDAEAQALEVAMKESKLIAQRRASASKDRGKALQQSEAETLEAAIQESKLMAQSKPPIPPPVRAQQGKRFFQEKETDLVEAAIQASKATVQRKPPALPTTAQRGKRFFQEKETDLVQAAIQESKMMAQKKAPAYQSKKVPLKSSDTNTTRGKRTLQRVQSVATDYGDDDLTEQDLLGLC